MTDCKLSRLIDSQQFWTYAKIDKPKVGAIVTIPILTDTGKLTDEGKIVAEVVRSEWKIMEICT